MVYVIFSNSFKCQTNSCFSPFIQHLSLYDMRGKYMHYSRLCVLVLRGTDPVVTHPQTGKGTHTYTTNTITFVIKITMGCVQCSSISCTSVRPVEQTVNRICVPHTTFK